MPAYQPRRLGYENFATFQLIFFYQALWDVAAGATIAVAALGRSHMPVYLVCTRPTRAKAHQPARKSVLESDSATDYNRSQMVSSQRNACCYQRANVVPKPRSSAHSARSPLAYKS